MGEQLALDSDFWGSSGVITGGPIAIWGYAIDTDAVNDVSVEIWNADKTKLIYPRVVWAATDKFKQPLMTKARYSKNGLKLVAKSKGWFRFVPFYQNWQ